VGGIHQSTATRAATARSWGRESFATVPIDSGDVGPPALPVQDCHGISGDRHGRIVTLTNHTRNNLLAYNKDGVFLAAWETRFPGAHGLDIVDHQGQDQYWITDQNRQLVSVCTAEGRNCCRWVQKPGLRVSGHQQVPSNQYCNTA